MIYFAARQTPHGRPSENRILIRNKQALKSKIVDLESIRKWKMFSDRFGSEQANDKVLCTGGPAHRRHVHGHWICPTSFNFSCLENNISAFLIFFYKVMYAITYIQPIHITYMHIYFSREVQSYTYTRTNLIEMLPLFRLFLILITSMNQL